jgi:hypothetical protein
MNEKHPTQNENEMKLKLKLRKRMRMKANMVNETLLVFGLDRFQ